MIHNIKAKIDRAKNTMDRIYNEPANALGKAGRLKQQRNIIEKLKSDLDKVNNEYLNAKNKVNIDIDPLSLSFIAIS